MQLLSNVILSLKDMRARFQRPYSIPKEQRFFLLVLIIQHVYGMWKQANISKPLKDMKIKFSLASSITKEILLSQGQRITHVEFGEIV
jgi:hypothetical protein